MIECVFTHVGGLKLTTYDDSTITIFKSFLDGTMSLGKDVIVNDDGPLIMPTELELSNIGDLMKELRAMSNKVIVHKNVRLISLLISSIKDYFS